MVIIASAFIVLPGAASIVVPDFVEGNPTCNDIVCGWDGFKIEPGPWAGTHNIDGLGTVTIEMVNDTHFNYTTSGVLINAVIVKGGPCANVYNYDSPVTADTILGTPWNPNNGDDYYGISHIDFCYEAGTPTPPPVPEFPFYMPAMMAVFALAMGAAVISLGKLR